VRRTPLLASPPLHDAPGDFDLYLKLENLQVTGSFKPRGATNCLLQLSPDEVARGIVTASGGNHGLAVAYAGYQADTRAVVYLPGGTAAGKIEAIRAWGAEVVVEGSYWDDANEAALARRTLLVATSWWSPSAVAGSSPASPRRSRRSGPLSGSSAWNPSAPPP
jgi:threonine dehydratase